MTEKASFLVQIGRFLAKNYLVVLILLTYQYGKYKNQWPELIFGCDSEGYYMYLPATFLAGGFDKYKPNSPDGYFPLKNGGQHFSKYTCGVAYLEAPFFFAARIRHTLKYGNSGDGKGPIYGRAISLAATFYAFLGLFFLKKTLERAKIQPKWVALTTIGLFLGTNWMFYATRDPGHSHVYSAFLVAVFVWLLPLFFEKLTTRRAVGMGFLLGLITLIRPTNVLIGLVFLLHGVSNWADLKARVSFFLKNWIKMALLAAAAAVVWLPQMAYWKSVTGSWFLWSYEKEGFIYWKAPKIGLVLFDYQNGLFPFAPIVAVGVVALIYGFRKNWGDSRSVLAVFIGATYLFASWWAWFFGAAFGHRCYVDLLPLLALPMAFFFQNRVEKWPRWAFFTAVGLVILMIYYTTGLTFVYEYPWERPDFNWSRLGHEILKILPPFPQN